VNGTVASFAVSQFAKKQVKGHFFLSTFMTIVNECVALGIFYAMQMNSMLGMQIAKLDEIFVFGAKGNAISLPIDGWASFFCYS
jgi:hypothetical protein